MQNLISFDGLADVTNNLINKLSSAVGWIATHDTPNRVAIETYINDIQNSNFDPLTKATLISNARKTIKEHRNNSEIVKIALQALSPSANPNSVDDDWLAQFMDKARLVSDQQFQILWGNILAEECNMPGSIPKSLLHIMEQIDRDMAEAFVKIASVSVWYEYNGERIYVPILIGETLDEYYKNLGIRYGDLVELQSVGLIEQNFGMAESSFAQIPNFSPIIVHYYNHEYTIPNNEQEFSTGNVVFTGAGQALCSAITVEEVEGFFEERCIPFWEKEATKSAKNL